jgi:DNA-3-methyladenine glycosylase II
MAEHTVRRTVEGPWSLATSRRFWEELLPAPLARQPDAGVLRTVFLVDEDWFRAEAEVTQDGSIAEITVRGDGDLDAAAGQVARFLALDVDAREWPRVGRRDPVIAGAQRELPGLRPCGFHSPYEAAAWAVLAQRVRMVQAAKTRAGLIGDDGTFPAPVRLRKLDLDLPGRKTEFLHAVAEAALDGELDGARLRAADPDEAIRRLQSIKGIGPFAAELIVLRGANVPDGMRRQDPRLEAEIKERYGPGAGLEVAENWRPFRTWGAVHLRALHEERRVGRR